MREDLLKRIEELRRSAKGDPEAEAEVDKIVAEVEAPKNPEPKKQPRKLSKKQQQIVSSMKSTIAESHGFDRWYKRYGKNVPLVVAEDLWAVALRD